MEHFWLKVFLLIGLYSLLIYVFNKLTMKWLNVEKKKFFSDNHVHNNHKKMDWTIRITFLVIVIISVIINIMRIHNGLEKIWFLETYVVLFIFIIVTEAARAIMERKYAENRNDYKITILRLMFISTLLLLTFTTNFFGLV